MNKYYPIEESEIKLAEKIARKYTRSNAWALVPFDDAFSHLTLWLYSNVDTVVSCREADEHSKLTEKYLYTCLRNEVNKFCAKETKSAVHTNLDNTTNYSIYNLTQALPILFKINYTEFEMNSDSSNLAYDISSDIVNALYCLSNNDIELIELRYKFGYSGKALAEKLGIEENAASQRVHRALERLLSKLASKPTFKDKPTDYLEL